MTIRIAINGFGRIGRLVTRIAKLRHEFNIVAINDLGDSEALAPLFKYDSAHGIYPGEVRLEGDTMYVDDDNWKFLSVREPSELPWSELGVDYVIEASGAFRKREQVQAHIDAGAKRVLMTVPSKDEVDATIVMGVNDDDLTPEAKIVSNASCTTNCCAPVAKVLHDQFSIQRGVMNTVHAYTNDQHLLDGPHKKDPRRARSAALSIIPTSTGAGKAVGKVIPDLEGKFAAMAMRVPTPTGSIVDMTVTTEKPLSPDSVNSAMRDACASDLLGIVHYNTDPLVSCDIVGNSHSAIFDAPLTQAIDEHTIRVCAWYDNEWGYSNRVVDLVERMAMQDGLEVKLTTKGVDHARRYG